MFPVLDRWIEEKSAEHFKTVRPSSDVGPKAVDLYKRFGVFFRILAPQIRSALIVVAIYQFTWSWNDFFGPLIYLNSPKLFTITLGLTRFMGRTQTDIQYLVAMTVVSTLVPITIFFLTQRVFLQGILITGVKG
jgi:multiple sugar transport system permease protein